MNIEQISMEPAVALAKMQAYKRAMEKAQTSLQSTEYRAVAKAYKALSKGRRILDIADAFKRTGLDQNWCPRLAMLPATATRCYYPAGRSEHQFFQLERGVSTWRRSYAKHRCFTVPVGALSSGETAPEAFRNKDFFAQVPIIPAPLMPKIALSNFHILWEPVWREEPPVDPFLLRCLGGALYVVEAAWDLTPVERAVMRGRVR